jgi:hypothetical protein
MDEEEEEVEEEEEEAPAKATKKPAKKVAAKSKETAEEEEEEEEPPAKAAAKSPAKDDEEEEEPADEEAEEPEAKRAVARVAKKVSIYEEADAESEELFVARPTDILYPVETKGNWTAVENAEGDYGWVQTDFLEMEGGGGGGGVRKRRIDVGARVGVMIIQQGMRTAGSTNLKVPDNYNIGTSAMTFSLGGAFLMPFKAKYLLGADAGYDYSKTLFGGITYNPPDVMGQPATPPVTTGVTVHNINVRAMGGYDFRNKRGMAVFGRLGYRYQSYLVDNYADATKNPARIPQEIMKAPTLGAAFVMPQLTSKIGLGFTLDAILFGASLSQTKGLEDGSAPSLKAVTFGTAVAYQWKKTMHIAFNYDLRYTGIDFGPPLASSMRGHMGNNVTRTDIFHMVTVGVAKPF